jgi:hypothetical protein
MDNSKFIKLSKFSFMALKDGIMNTVNWYVSTIKNNPNLIKNKKKN